MRIRPLPAANPIEEISPGLPIMGQSLQYLDCKFALPILLSKTMRLRPGISLPSATGTVRLHKGVIPHFPSNE